MRKIRAWFVRLGGLFYKARRDRELAEELESHLQMHIEDNLRSGMTPAVARRDALIKLGGVEQSKEAYRDRCGLPWLETLVQDLRHGSRMLWKDRGFTLIVVLTLALGMGASTAIYSVVNTVIFHPVPGLDPDQLAEIGERSHGNKDEFEFGGVTTASIEILKTKQEFFSDVVWYTGLYLERKTEDFFEEIGATAVSPNFFSQWNIHPILGRTFGQDEAVRLNDRGEPEKDSVIVLSYSLWQSRFGGAAAVLGRTIEASGRHYTVIGVMPPHFQFPRGDYSTFWTPAANPPPQDGAANNHMFARLKPGITLQQTQAMLNTVAQQLLKEFPAIYDDSWRRRGGGFGFLLRPLRDGFTNAPYGAMDLQQTLWGLFAAIGFVLLIVCVNVANLMLARTEKRQQELVIRAAVGAGRVRLMRQLLTESVLLAGLGTLGGLAVTFGGLKILISLIPETIPRLRPIEVDGHVLSAALILSIGTALAFGLVPAWHASRTSVGNALKQVGTGATISAGWRRYRGALVIAEVALSLLLLTGAGLMIKSVMRTLRVNPGFDPENLLFVHPGLLRGEKYYYSERSAEVHSALYGELQERFAALPGVKAVGISKIEFFRLGFAIEGREKPIGLLAAGTGVGQSDLFRAMRIPLLAGRYFEKTDIGSQVGTVLVNESLARLCWPGEDALGKKFRQYNRVYEVIGIVGDARADLRTHYNDPIEPTFYRPYQENAASGGFGPFFVVRTQRDPRALIPAIRATMKAVESSMTMPWFQVARQTLYDATQAQRTYMLYLIVFAGVGLLLSALGIYGVLAYAVARRTREIGIRIAMGAQRRHVVSLVMREGTRLVGMGVVVGIVAAFWLTRLLEHQLFQVSPTDPIVLAAVVLVLLAVALLACYLPARRAMKINPMESLRCE